MKGSGEWEVVSGCTWLFLKFRIVMMSLMWGFMFSILTVQVFIIVLLCMPLPSNTIRGRIVTGLQSLWRSSYKIRTFTRVVMFVIALMFMDALRSAYTFAEQHHEGNQMAHNDLMLQIQRFRNQRNAYITGFSLFLGGVIWRLMVLIAQLYECRETVKRTEVPPLSPIPVKPKDCKKKD